MDGVLFAARFFPVLVFTCLNASIATFVFTLWVGFSQELQKAVEDLATLLIGDAEFRATHFGYIEWMIKSFNSIVGSPPLSLHSKSRVSFSFALPLLISVVTCCTVLSIYSVGGALQHAKRGWKFVQPGRGGSRFVILQLTTWIFFALSLILPWTAIDGLGLLAKVGLVKPASTDPKEHHGLVLAGAAMGMLANTTNLLSLMTFGHDQDHRSRPGHKARRAQLHFGNDGSLRAKTIAKEMRILDTGRWKWDTFGDGGLLWWWLFMALQWALVVFSFTLAYVAESDKLTNDLVQAVLLMVLNSLLAAAVSIANVVGGKWKHGENVYSIFMPLQGGIRFVFWQGVGWVLFSAATLLVVLRLLSLIATFFESDIGIFHNSWFGKLSLTSASAIGILAYLSIFISLFFFDPQKVNLEQVWGEELALTSGKKKGFILSPKKVVVDRSDTGKEKEKGDVVDRDEHFKENDSDDELIEEDEEDEEAEETEEDEESEQEGEGEDDDEPVDHADNDIDNGKGHEETSGSRQQPLRENRSRDNGRKTNALLRSKSHHSTKDTSGSTSSRRKSKTNKTNVDDNKSYDGDSNRGLCVSDIRIRGKRVSETNGVEYLVCANSAYVGVHSQWIKGNDIGKNLRKLVESYDKKSRAQDRRASSGGRAFSPPPPSPRLQERSVSPGPRKSEKVHNRNAYDDYEEEETDEEKETEEEETEEEGEHAKDIHREGEHAKLNTPSDEEWEELEDENGNVFLYNEASGRSIHPPFPWTSEL